MMYEILNHQVWGCLLIAMRVGIILAYLPLFGGAQVPNMVKVIFLVFVSILVSANVNIPKIPPSTIEIAAMVLQELMIGLSIALSMKIFESALHVFGSIVANQSGFSSATLFDPMQNVQGTIFGTFFSVCFTAVVLASDMHLLFLHSIQKSYDTLAIGEFYLHYNDFVDCVIKSASVAFTIGVQMGSPFLILGVLFSVLAGVLSRLMPQMQVFFVLMPAQIILHMVILFFTISVVIGWFVEYYVQHFLNIF